MLRMNGDLVPIRFRDLAAGELEAYVVEIMTRTQQDRWYAVFDEVADRTDAESLRGVDLVLEVDEDEEEWGLGQDERRRVGEAGRPGQGAERHQPRDALRRNAQIGGPRGEPQEGAPAGEAENEDGDPERRERNDEEADEPAEPVARV